MRVKGIINSDPKNDDSLHDSIHKNRWILNKGGRPAALMFWFSNLPQNLT